MNQHGPRSFFFISCPVRRSPSHVRTKGLKSKYLFMRKRNEQKVRIRIVCVCAACAHIATINMMPHTRRHHQESVGAEVRQTASSCMYLHFYRLIYAFFAYFLLFFLQFPFHPSARVLRQRERTSKLWKTEWQQRQHERQTENTINMSTTTTQHSNNEVHDLPLWSSSVSVLAV